jgi:signal transduction histidine kinase
MTRAIDVLVRFGELLSSTASSRDVMQLLAKTAVEELGARAAVVVAIDEKGTATVGASHGLPAELPGFPGDVDAFGDELGDALLARCAGLDVAHGAQARTIPLASAGGLYGSLVLLFPSDARLEEHQVRLAGAIAALAASGLGHAARFAELQRSYAELRASREVLERSQKLRALGEMAAGVSHDLKNIINPLSLHLQFLRRSCPKDATDAQESIGEMKRILDRGLETIERLRDFSRQAPARRADLVDLDRLAREAIEIARPRTRTKHDVHYQLVERLGAPPPVKLQGGEAVAAIVNLIVNAIDAMPNGGTITVETGAIERESAQGPDEGVYLRVRDDGPGMSAETEARVFEPFFTTKGEEGTGLGLAMVYAFVQRHHGKITLETAPGAGATFSMIFPAARSEVVK